MITLLFFYIFVSSSPQTNHQMKFWKQPGFIVLIIFGANCVKDEGEAIH